LQPPSFDAGVYEFPTRVKEDASLLPLRRSSKASHKTAFSLPELFHSPAASHPPTHLAQSHFSFTPSALKSDSPGANKPLSVKKLVGGRPIFKGKTRT